MAPASGFAIARPVAMNTREAMSCGNENDSGREQRAEAVDDQTEAVDPGASQEVAYAPKGQREAGDHDRADDRHPLEGRERDIELVLNFGKGDVDAAVGAGEHEGAGAEDAEQARL